MPAFLCYRFCCDRPAAGSLWRVVVSLIHAPSCLIYRIFSAGAEYTDVMKSVTVEDVRAARTRIAPQLRVTPCSHSVTLSSITGAEIWLKFENLQFTSSFKERGALNALLLLNDEQKARGVIAVSAGNHAQALAHHGRRLGLPTTIVTVSYTHLTLPTICSV